MARYDALVVGAGPAGSIAALVLARGGARVALVDKASFPRDKACGDLIGPRGVQVLQDLDLVPAGRQVGDMEVVGPTGRRVVLPAFPGVTYPGYGLAVGRRRLDAGLREAALSAGADGLTGRAATPTFAADGQLDGFHLEGGDGGGVQVGADVVIGADGALSRVAVVSGLIDERRVLWGFAVRGYAPEAPRLPRIAFWEPAPWAGYPGYGWDFPGEEDEANIGLGIGVRGDRRSGARATRDLEAFVSSVRPGSGPLERRLGGWLKMGMVGTVAARGRTLLIGDAAGLVNSLQGEGISQALGSGRAAAEAVLSAGPAGASTRYRADLAAQYAAHATTTAAVTAWMLRKPRAIAAIGRVLTAPGIGRALAGGWGIYWNDLLDGASPGRSRDVAVLADTLGRMVTLASEDRSSVWASVDRPDWSRSLRRHHQR